MSSTFLNIVHELEPKKNEYLGLGCLLSRKVWWTSKSRGFLQTGMDHMNMNFEYFQIEKWMLKTARAERVDEKKWIHLFSLHVPFLTYGPEIVLKKWAFCSLMLKSARHLNVLKQFTDMHPKDLVTHFQKYVLFIMLCFNRLRFLAENSTKLQLGKEPWKLDKWPHFFSSTFSTVTVFNIYFCI